MKELCNCAEKCKILSRECANFTIFTIANMQCTRWGVSVLIYTGIFRCVNMGGVGVL